MASLAATLGAICIVLTVVAIAFGARPIVIKTGSMEPKLPIGTVVIARSYPADDAKVGEIVALHNAEGQRIMHRVRRIVDGPGGSATLVLRGDRNRVSDPPVTVSTIEKPVITLPIVGRVVEALDTGWSQFWLGILTAVLAFCVLSAGLRRVPEEDPDRWMLEHMVRPGRMTHREV